MGLTKSELFTERQNLIAKMAKAIAHPARIAILEYLIQHNTCVCGDIVDKLPLSQSTVSQHLKAMKEAGIIKGNIEGAFTCYCVDRNQCVALMNAVRDIFSKMTNCC